MPELLRLIQVGRTWGSGMGFSCFRFIFRALPVFLLIAGFGVWVGEELEKVVRGLDVGRNKRE